MSRLWQHLLPLAALACLLGLAGTAAADPFSFSTGAPDGRVGIASRPPSPGHIEIEAADDFKLPTTTSITKASFTGLLPAGLPLSSIGGVTIEIYRVFPNDSDLGRTIKVPTRVNSPADNLFVDRSTGDGNLSFTVSIVSPNFTAANTVVNGINPSPNQTTGGEGPATGQEVTFEITFISALTLPGDHYFFIPQVELSDGNFLWLSAAGPTAAGDLQAWIRNGNLDPDWLRVGTDIIGGGNKFNGSFSLQGQTVPEPATLLLLGIGLTGVVGVVRRRRKAQA